MGWMNAFTDFAGPGTRLAPSAGPAKRRNLSASPVRATALGGTSTEERLLAQYRARNGVLDRVFYHVEPEDEARVVCCDHQQGSIIVVHPDWKRDLSPFPDPVAFLADPVANEVIAISIAGVGSSAIGAVALARDVATVKDGPVAAIVSGYGLDDVMYEGLGGWFYLRETNRLDFALEQAGAMLARLSLVPPLATRIEVMDSIGSGPDLFTLKCLLRTRHLGHLQWLVGHSKGNLLISSAISELIMEQADLRAGLQDVRIVLLSALSALPADIGLQHQAIGSMDVLGWVNSRLNIDHVLVPGAMHHLNRRLPYHLDAQAQLSRIA
jgi:hypothetical protein